MTPNPSRRGLCFPPGSQVKLARPEFRSHRAGQVGTVRETVEFWTVANPDRKTPADYVVLHVVDFDTDSHAANGMNLGPVPSFSFGYELEPA